MTHWRQMSERLTAKRVEGCHLVKDPGCVFKGHVPQEAVPRRSSPHRRTRLVAARSQVLVPTPQRRGWKAADWAWRSASGSDWGHGICGLWDESPSGSPSQQSHFINFPNVESDLKLEGGKKNTFGAWEKGRIWLMYSEGVNQFSGKRIFDQWYEEESFKPPRFQSL